MAANLEREPVSLAVAKSHLGVRTAFRDAEIGNLIVAARERVEAYSYRGLFRRVVVEEFGAFHDDGLVLSRGPVHAINAIRYVAEDGNQVEIDGAARVFRRDNVWKVYPPAGTRWPRMGDPAHCEIEYVGGFGPLAAGTTGSPVAIPEELVRAMLLLVGTWFENHEGAVVGTITAELPFGVKDICRDYRPSGVV